jgi:hypothetical protein
VDYQFRADDFDDLEQRTASTSPEIEQAPIVLIFKPCCMFHRVFDVRVEDAMFAS